jgi:hypothetical protein
MEWDVSCRVADTGMADEHIFLHHYFFSQLIAKHNLTSQSMLTRCDTERGDYAVHTLNQAMKSTCTTEWHP